MKPFQEESGSADAVTCAALVMEVTPHVMQAMREEVRRARGAEFSVPQFRALSYLERHKGASLGEVAEHIGLSLPTLSKLVDGLVARNLVRRRPAKEDRRRLTLALTAHGRRILGAAHEAAQEALAERLKRLSEDDLGVVAEAMRALRPLFVQAAAGE